MVKKSTKMNITIEKGTKIEEVHLKNVTHTEIGVDIAISAIDMFTALGSPNFITRDEAATLTTVSGNRVLVDKKATVEYACWATIAEYACECDNRSFCSKDLPSKSSPARFAVVEETLLMEMSEIL